MICKEITINLSCAAIPDTMDNQFISSIDPRSGINRFLLWHQVGFFENSIFQTTLFSIFSHHFCLSECTHLVCCMPGAQVYWYMLHSSGVSYYKQMKLGARPIAACRGPVRTPTFALWLRSVPTFRLFNSILVMARDISAIVSIFILYSCGSFFGISNTLRFSCVGRA